LFMTTIFSKRQKALLSELTKRRLGGLLVTHPASWYYLTGFTGDAGALVVTGRGVALITDGRFTAQAADETSGVKIVRQQGPLAAAIGQFLRSARARSVGFDSSRVSVAQFEAMRKAGGSQLRWAAAPGMVEALRARKDEGELVRMRRAAVIADKVIQGAMKLLKPGIRELEVSAEIEYQMKSLGASGSAFETIVASGKNSAYPHARPTSKRLRKNELVVLDLGVILAHYCSDISRTLVIGKATPRVRQWHRAVQEAQSAAIETVQAGVSCGEVDNAARKVLAGHDLESYFTHSTGHGLGIEVHEDPRVAKGQQQLLEPGNVITIEPGIYVPGVGGIRIEDDVAVYSGKTEVFTRTPRDLIEI
jgi:Xaa-Pro aminopeptidase